MPDNHYHTEHLVFGLDIGTRSIVGSVGYLENNNKFNVVAHYSKEHETRAMLDGQIHDISRVADTISKVKNELEMQLNRPLNDVCIAAAGRVLKTITVHIDYELPQETTVTDEQIYSLELMGVEKAYDIIRQQEKEIKFYCVGYTVVKYFLNDFAISNLEGHKARKISADVLATFLPDDVVDGLYSAVGEAGLNVENLTLEPIAAINIAIPQKFRLLNIALVDVGAGTSDICITKDGSIIAYGMIPRAGDEITEHIVSKYLVEFNVAEKIKRASIMKRQISFKDIMGLKQKVSPEEVRNCYSDKVNDMTKEIADKILELNGGKSVSAVFVVGGGGKVDGFTSDLAKHLDIPDERVALRGEEVLGNVNFEQENVKKDPLLVTPIGICLSFYDQKNNFIFVNVNGERIKLYDNNKLSVVDAAMQIGLQNESLFPRRGDALEYTLNGVKRMIRGEIGEPAVITVNGEEANINTKIIKNDNIVIKESTVGEKASLTVSKLPEYKDSMNFIINNKKVSCPRFVSVNGKLEPEEYKIQQNDEVQLLDYYTLEQLMQFIDIDDSLMAITINNVPASAKDLVYENFKIDIHEKSFKDYEETVEQDEQNNVSVNESSNENTIHSDGNAILEDSKSNKQNTLATNDIQTQEGHNEQSTTQNSVSKDTSDMSLESENSGNEENVNQKDILSNQVKHDITVNVNGTTTVLKNKSQYIFVDILDFYSFDTRVAGGKELIITVNGNRCEFTTPIYDGDITEIYWRK